MEKLKTKQKEYYNKGSKELEALEEGNTVRIKPQDGKEWKKAIVLKVLPYKSYIVKTESGREYRRNRRDLIKTKEKFDDAY